MAVLREKKMFPYSAGPAQVRLYLAPSRPLCSPYIALCNPYLMPGAGAPLPSPLQAAM